MLKQVKVREVGDLFPNLRLPLLDGGQVEVGAFRGRRLLIFSWSSW